MEQCYAILRARPPRDFAMSILELLAANTTPEERRESWRAVVNTVVGDERTEWIDYGLHMQVLAGLPQAEFDGIMLGEDLNRKRLKVVFRLPQLALWEENEEKFSVIADAILDGDIGPTGQSRSPRRILHLLAHTQSLWRFGVALRNRHPIPLSTAWEKWSEPRFPSMGDNDAVTLPNHPSAKRCWEFIDTVRRCAEGSLEEWASDLTHWDTMIERSRELFGPRWGQCRLACLAGSIRSNAEKCNDFPDLFDASKSLCRRARYARLRAGQAAWWAKQLQQAKNEMDSGLAFLILLTSGSPNCLTNLAPIIAPALEALSSSAWRKLWLAMRQILDVIRVESGGNVATTEFAAVSTPSCERMIAAFGERASADAAADLYKRYLSDYSGSDYPVLHFAQRQAIRLLFADLEDKPLHMSVIERSYARGVMPELGIARSRRGNPSAKGLTAEVAEQIASYPDRYPMEIVGVAEDCCKEIVSSHIVPVGSIAQRDKWFPD